MSLFRAIFGYYHFCLCVTAYNSNFLQLDRNHAILTDEEIEEHTISAWKDIKFRHHREVSGTSQPLCRKPLIQVNILNKMIYPGYFVFFSWSMDQETKHVSHCEVFEDLVFWFRLFRNFYLQFAKSR